MAHGVPRAVQYGVGPIGSRIVGTAIDRGIEFVGAIDIDPDAVGRDLGEVAGLGDELDVPVTDDPRAALDTAPDVVFHATTSDLAAAVPQLREALAAGADVISTCEPLAYPWWDHPELAADIDDEAQSRGVTCLGTGINPGFAMDVLPAVVTTPCRRVERVRVERVQDASTRREPLQRKVGVGMAGDATEAPSGHVGLAESVAMLADAIGWDLTEIEEDVEPVIASRRLTDGVVPVEAGDVAGIHQTAIGRVGDEDAIELDLELAVGAREPRDVITVTGDPDVHVTSPGGFHGDVTTPAVVVNAVPGVRAAAPGVTTMTGLRSPSFWDGGRVH